MAVKINATGESKPHDSPVTTNNIRTRMRKDSLCGTNVSTGLSLFLRFHTVKVPLV